MQWLRRSRWRGVWVEGLQVNVSEGLELEDPLGTKEKLFSSCMTTSTASSLLSMAGMLTGSSPVFVQCHVKGKATWR